MAFIAHERVDAGAFAIPSNTNSIAAIYAAFAVLSGNARGWRFAVDTLPTRRALARVLVDTVAARAVPRAVHPDAFVDVGCAIFA